MSIQTATDLILDVVNAADPAIAQRAEAMLEAASVRKSAQAAGTPAFEHQLLASTDAAAALSPAQKDPASDKTAQSYQRFEAMVLQNFIGGMLPQDSEELYGKGTAGEIWRSMMAEQLGAVLAEGGGIGIAARLLADRFAPGLAPESADGVGSNVSNRAASMVNEVQKQILAGISATGEPADVTQETGRRA